MSARILYLPIPSAAEPTFTWGRSPEPRRDLPWPSLPCPDSHPDPHRPALPPVSISEARTLRDALAGLIHRERAATADFLLALADFDRRRGWEALGHRSLFDFLKRELRFSSGAASHRSAAARLIPAFPAVEAALRAGDLCLSSLHHLARVLRPENEEAYLPRFFGLSAREAETLAAELSPRAVQPRREVVTMLAPPVAVHTCEQKRTGGVAGYALGGLDQLGISNESNGLDATAERSRSALPLEATGAPATGAHSNPAPPGEGFEVPWPSTRVRPQPPSKAVEPLSADLRRLHLTVSTRLLGKLESAKDGLAHALPGATAEQVLEAALDLLLEKQARRRGLVKRPRTSASAQGRKPDGASATAATGPTTGSLPGPPTARPRHIPAAIRREVWLRDGQRCQHPIDSGGTCGATTQLELDHLVPLALGGPSTADNLRVVCAFHNRAAARVILGDAMVEDHRKRCRQRRAARAT